MINFTTYEPIRFLLKTIYEFENDKVRIKEKSLLVEAQDEIDYRNIAHFDFREIRNESLANFGFFTLMMIAIIFSILFITDSTIRNNIAILALGRIASVIGIAAFSLSYKNNLTCFLRNQQGDFLGGIKIDPGNYKVVMQALSMVTKKVKGIKQTSPYKSLPKAKPKYEIIDHNLATGMKSITKFYNNRIIAMQSSMSYKSVFEVNYSDLSEQLFQIRRTNNDWFETSLTAFVLVISLFIIAFLVFSIPTTRLVWKILPGLIALLLSPSLLWFIKEEWIGFYDRQGNLTYAIKTSGSNKETVKQIIQFVRSKTSPKKSGGTK